MDRIWLVTNAASGSFTAAGHAALFVQLDRLGCTVVETSDFPRAALPDRARLEAARIDTLALYAGDGSIAAAISASDGWDGRVLVLPGGTMNLLAKRLHAGRGVEAIVEAVKAGDAGLAPLAGARAGEAVALVGVIAGPVTAWSQVREDVRDGALGQLAPDIVAAVRETVAGEGVRMAGLEGEHRAVLIFPEGDRLEGFAPAPGGIGETVRLGWDLIAGDWRLSAGVARIAGDRLEIEAPAELALLADGEPIEACAPLAITRVMTSQHFHATERG